MYAKTFKQYEGSQTHISSTPKDIQLFVLAQTLQQALHYATFVNLHAQI